MGLARDIQITQTWLLVMAGVMCVLHMAFEGYYPLTKQYKFTYFATPASYGVLSSYRFASLDWFMTGLYVLPELAIFWIPVMLIFWDVKWYKLALIIYLAILLMFGVSFFVIQTIWLTTKNDPTTGNLDNPANSYRACCAPEFYMAVQDCPNFGKPSPDCNPAIALGELGTNGDFVFAYTWTILSMALEVLLLWFTIQLMRLRDKFEEKGGDQGFVVVSMPPTKAPDGGGGTTLLPAQQAVANPIPMGGTASSLYSAQKLRVAPKFR